MSIRHTCQPQQSSPSNCIACDLSGVGAGHSTANYGQPYGPHPGVEAPRYVQPHGNAVHPDVSWMNQSLSSAPRNPFAWREEPSDDRYGMQGGAPSPGPGYPYPTSLNISGPRLTAPPAGGETRQPAQPPQVAGHQYPSDLGQTQQRQTPANQQRRQQEAEGIPSSKSGKRRSKEPPRSTHK
ncbi:hypothetical protein KC360_g7510 [Hortaea werneckii]|nr:hypothetical protein KC361_g2265 [Hortaea werneckii]KAI6887648.1 hypothetical protein KC325_g1907 [Hortaea werneckii]KAI6998369.1 hypothetical protein KC359_g2388 [Hortaea werneckii]KAI7149135.1 hypothetical protein KC344_g1261 [Hortaea werneckii]KAI7169384.1 hypothetical protein KC360_g7510 [Hortaea werneckii]